MNQRLNHKQGENVIRRVNKKHSLRSYEKFNFLSSPLCHVFKQQEKNENEKSSRKFIDFTLAQTFSDRRRRDCSEFRSNKSRLSREFYFINLNFAKTKNGNKKLEKTIFLVRMIENIASIRLYGIATSK